MLSEELFELHRQVRITRSFADYKYNKKGTMNMSVEECEEELKKLEYYIHNVGN